ncbi:hypothetical protein BO94DRAFT_2299 [Aspergillus sclerotioniger CBS 115572]|uniref:Protein kinase domain-containing protein n=1 Tax=Aspergillus sclerotioniger CBS 115572 TaxID=1450535 RepID=A0A317XET5_9EURO|nr:hypothetical protein BO94DRAFT_2299 [Aspergillus sclerotioniger CBS 115572]PWY96197.1 hypothetical protein BO94DRAFT_2299 [Aspergillus sclerotioniger CBS 115572]
MDNSQDLVFLEKLHSSEASQIFRVSFKGTECCLKFHKDDDPGLAPDGRDLCRYRCESQAYRALQAHGVCGKGVPQFYETLENLDPSAFELNLQDFTEDKNLPCAILLEWLPDARPLRDLKWSPQRVEPLLAALDQIHQAGVIHNDAYPKNILILQRQEGERIVWIGFDVSIVFVEGRRDKLNYDDEVDLENQLIRSSLLRLEFPGHEFA